MRKTEHKILRPVAKQPRPRRANLAYCGKLFQVWQWRHKLGPGAHATFETVTRPDTALLLPIVRPGIALLARERQPGMKPMLRTIGGKIEPGETPESAARRELREETGFETGDLRLWNAWQPLNKMDWAVYLFVAHDLRHVSGPTLEPGESVATKEVFVKELLGRPTKLGIDDYELLFHLFRANSDSEEMRRVKALLTARAKRR